MLKPLDCDGDHCDDDDNGGGDDDPYREEERRTGLSCWDSLRQCSISTLPAIQFNFEEFIILHFV